MTFDDVRKRSRLPDVYRSPDVFRLPAKKIERGPHENRKINANLKITTPTTSYPMTLASSEKNCDLKKIATGTLIPRKIRVILNTHTPSGAPIDGPTEATVRQTCRPKINEPTQTK